MKAISCLLFLMTCLVISAPAYSAAKETYAALGVDTEKALTTLASIPISLHCWQGDDVGGFKKEGAILSGGEIQSTGNYPGKQLGSTVVTNVWIPDGSKDIPVDRKTPRERLESALDEVFAEAIDPAYNLDAGHFHPTESLADKISCVLQFVPEILLHVSRGVRWDSDHVVLMDDATKSIAEEIVRGNFLPRTHIGLDFFDGSINRIAAWVIGTRSALKCLLAALLEPSETLRHLENEGDFSSRLALLEELKTLPLGAVWEEFCRRQETPGADWIGQVKKYESDVLSKRHSIRLISPKNYP